MDITTPQLVTTCYAMAGGTADVPGVGEKHTVGFTGTFPDAGSTFTIILTDGTTALQVQVGAGNITGIVPTYCYTYSGKLYVLGGSTGYFSAIDEPTVFNDPLAVGNGFVSFSNQFKTPEDLLAMAPIQGRLAFLSPQTTQIWIVDADPTKWTLAQLLQNIGTISKLSVQPKGDFDVMFLSNSGVRSLRSREVTLNAYVDDTGSPIDIIVQKAILNSKNIPGKPAGTPSASGGTLASNTYHYVITAWVGGVEGPPSLESDAITVTGPTGSVALAWAPVANASNYSIYRTLHQGRYDSPSLVFKDVIDAYTDTGTAILTGVPPGSAEASCGIVEPTSLRYWLYLNGLIYVHSYFPSSKVQAWSVYEPTDDQIQSNGKGRPFAPEKFVVFKGQVFCRASNRLYQYGGPSGNQYDGSPVTGELPWFDLKTPGTMKAAIGINAAYAGTWTIGIGMDPVSGVLEDSVWSSASYTYDQGIVPVSGRGSHFKAKLQGTCANGAIFSSLVFHYQEGEEV